MEIQLLVGIQDLSELTKKIPRLVYWEGMRKQIHDYV
jgi:hypothetical protein